MLPCPKVLGDEQGIGVAKLLRRHICQGINLHRRGEGCHDYCAEAVHQPLNHEDAEIHDGLLDACSHIVSDNLSKTLPVPVFPAPAQLGQLREAVGHNAQTGNRLGDYRGPGGPGNAHGQAHDEPDIQNDVQHRRRCQKQQRRQRIAHRPQQIGEEVIEKHKENAHKHRGNVLPHEGHQLRRRLQQPQYGVHAGIDHSINQHRHAKNKPEG